MTPLAASTIIRKMMVLTQMLLSHRFSTEPKNIFILLKIIIIMVLESMLNPRNAEDKPLHVFIISFLYSFLAVFFSHQLFPTQSSILSIALITIIFVPFFQKLFEIEERREAEKPKGNVFARHGKVIATFSAFFFGVLLSMNIIFAVFPSFSDVFTLQKEWFASTGAATAKGSFGLYFMNNTQVAVLVFILSMLFGAGVVLILAWNASVIGVYVGMLVQSFISKGHGTAAAFLYGIPVGLGSIALHGIPEIVAYFIASLAGGILSVGMIREKIASPEFRNVFKDSLIFLAAAEFLIIVAAFIEAMV